ncbi:MAG: aspartate kinase [Calditrichia bacterium]
MQVIKFGGTSLGAAEAFEHALTIIKNKNETTRLCVVASALSGVTNQLDAALTNAAIGGSDWQGSIEKLRCRHIGIITAYLNETEQNRLNSLLDRICFQLVQQLSGVRLLREASAKIRDSVLSKGEHLSAELVGAALRSRGQAAIVFNPVELIRTDARHGKASIDFSESARRIRSLMCELPEKTVAIVGGFIGGTNAGVTTTLGRGGSDYSAAIIASALAAERLEIWTDVDGVMNVDPQALHSAEIIKELSYSDAENLSRLGAKVLHPKTITPLIENSIPLQIRNTFKPDESGTRISSYAADTKHFDAIASQVDLSLITISGFEIDAFPGMLAEVYAFLVRNGSLVLHCETDRNSAILRLLLHTDEATLVMHGIENELVNRQPGLHSLAVERTDNLARISIVSSQLPFRHAASLIEVLEHLEERPLQVTQSNLNTFSLIVPELSVNRLIPLLHEALIADERDRESAPVGIVCARSAG